jgi:hypothetical protein
VQRHSASVPKTPIMEPHRPTPAVIDEASSGQIGLSRVEGVIDPGRIDATPENEWNQYRQPLSAGV